MDAVERGQAPLDQVDDPADGHHRPDQHGQIGDEGDKVTQGHGSLDDQTAAEIEDHEHPQVAHQGGQRRQQPLDHGDPDIAADDIAGPVYRTPSVWNFSMV